MNLKDFNEQLLGSGRLLLHTNALTFKVSQNYKFTCKNNHIVTQRANDVLRKIKVLNRPAKGCGECHQLEQDKQSLEKIKSELPEGFKIIGSYRKNVNRKEARTVNVYKFECNLGDYFERESGQCRNLSCPTCNATIHIGQERTREIFNQVFNVKFKSVRPNWLKNPKTNKNLELDGFNNSLSMGFEFQGNQHTSPNTQFGNEHYAQFERDKLKKEICEKLGVKLIEIHQPPKYEEEKFIKNVIEQIKKQINLLDYPTINLDEKLIHFNDLKFDGIRKENQDFLDYLQSESPIKGYSCITTDFHTYEDKITMCCPEGHNYETTAAEFKRNAEGKKGRDIPCITCNKEENKVNTIIDLVYCREEGKKHGLELLSTDYVNVSTELDWKDSNGKTIKLAFRKLQRRKLVKKPNTRGIDIAYCREKGKEFGLELLSTEYISVHHKMLWKKEDGEEVELYLRQLQRSKKNDPKPKTGITVDFCREEGRKYGLELLSTDYKNVNDKLLWKKENGDKVELTLRQIQRSKTGIF